MKIAIFSYSDQGCQLALRVAASYQAHGALTTCYAIAKFAEKYQLQAVPSTCVGVAAQFGQVDVMVFVGACGIAVRALAPLLQSKTTDPACLVVDDAAQFVIPLVSGHIGGANEQAQWLAKALGATPVVTTATDVNHRFAVDAFAAQQGFAISSMAAAKAFSAAILTRDLPLSHCAQVKICTPLASGLVLDERAAVHGGAFACADAKVQVQGETPVRTGAGIDVEKPIAPIGVYLGYQNISPYQTTLRLTPKMLSLGIGCKKNTPQQAIESLVAQVLSEHQIDPAAICGVASIDLKAQEAGLLAFCAEHGYPFQCYSAQQLQAVSGDFSFTPSQFVQSVTGVDNVCERAAVLAAQQGGASQSAHFICRKTSRNGVTLAIAAQELEVRFG